jgi:hypothetical protein
LGSDDLCSLVYSWHNYRGRVEIGLNSLAGREGSRLSSGVNQGEQI